MSTAHVHPFPANIDYKKQSVTVPGTKKPGQTAHYRNALFGLIDRNTPHSFTVLTDIFDEGYRLSKNKRFLGRRSVISQSPLKYGGYVWETYEQIDIRRRHVGSAITTLFRTGELSVAPGELETVGIWAGNRPEWQLVDLAMQAYNKITVSLYDTLGPDAVEYIINHAQTTVIFVSAEHIPTLLKSAASYPVLKLIVSLDVLTPEAKRIVTAWGQQQNIKVQDIHELEAFGKANILDIIKPTADQVASICYTSGTTSNPKGAVLTHANLAMAAQNGMYGLGVEEAIVIGYLPLAHIYERLVELAAIGMGGCIGYFTGDPLRLLEDCQVLKPTFMPSVPRVLNRVYQAAMAAGSVGGIKSALFNKAVEVKLAQLHSTGNNTHALWDRLVFRKVQAVIGGNVRLMTSGSAPISPDVMDFLKIALACQVDEGYGMTENAATTAKCLHGDPSSSGTVGPPGPVNEIKLIDVEAMGYTAEDSPNPRGEICVRGENCFKVYYKDEKNTASTVDSEGWVHTGDVGEIDECGRLKIIDRVKNIMKLSQGEYVALEKIENLYSTCPVVAQIFVHGSGLESYLIGVVVPDPIQLAAIISSVRGKHVSPTDLDALKSGVNDPAVNQKVLASLSKEAKRSGLRGFETVKRIHLTLDAFNIEDGTLTPTFKTKRVQAYAKFKSQLDGLYQLREPVSSGSKL